ncbi:MAG: helix-turn-helix domain-containing protein, partial [Candidatus Heimdallarchaeota archaeon]|nr:helix-turn-helix domain-containing protein [Candidatus Heimdallarchaeota archaeon]
MTREKRSLLLMHPVRREIYKIISETPGTYFFEIASALELPHGTVSWHVKKLETAGLVDTMRFAGRRVFFSKALRSTEVEKAFVVLRSEPTQLVFTYVLNNSNCYQAQIAEALGHHHDTVRHHIQRLKEAKLIESIKKGRNVHYTLGEIGRLILNSNTEIISKAYIE